jgi:hypothetical protein
MYLHACCAATAALAADGAVDCLLCVLSAAVAWQSSAQVIAAHCYPKYNLYVALVNGFAQTRCCLLQCLLLLRCY